MKRAAWFILLGAGLAACGGSDSGSPNSKWTGTIDVTSVVAAGTTTCASTQTVTITSTGVSKALVTIAGDGCVEFVNGDTIPHEPASSPHPTHGCLTNINPAGTPPGTAPVLLPGENFTTAPLGAGLAAPKNCGWHDHLNPPPAGGGGGY